MLLTAAVIAIAQFLTLGSAADYEAVIIETKLPTALTYISTVFDEVDSIYLFGGYNESSSPNYQILKFSVTEETVEEVGVLPKVSRGNAVWLGNESIVYFGGDSSSSAVWQSRTSDLSSWSEIGNLPFGSQLTTSFWDHQEAVYSFGGNSGTINYDVSKYNIVKQSAEVVARLSNPLMAASSVWDSENGVGYIFGGYLSRKDILKFDPEAVDETISLVATSPQAISGSCAVWTGEVAYVIAMGSVPSLLRFDPSTNQVTQIPVSNFPSELDYTGCAFVKSLNRLYIFGGYGYEKPGHYSDLITYIELSDNPTTLSPPKQE